MCGLVVVLQRGWPIDGAGVHGSLAALLHRGPDGHALETSVLMSSIRPDRPAVHVAIGHARLAILDPKPRSDQPFTRGMATLAYNGEIYNFRDLAGQLRSTGVAFETTGDTEVLFRLLERDGLEALGAANGMWALCWLDRASRRLVAARDRYGKKPLFYAVNGDRIVFASTMKSVRHLAGLDAVPAAGEIETYVRDGWLFPATDGTTWLDGVREVRPGHALELDIDAWTLREHRIARIDHTTDDPTLDQGTLGELLADAVTMRLVSDRRVGLLLSGGVDSSLILSILAARGLSDQVTCITGEAGKSEDAAFARRALDQLGIKPLIVPLDYGADAFEPFLDVCRHQEKPFPLIGNVLGMPALYRAIAADGIRVAIDGTGADEIFAGYWTRQAPFALRDAARAGDWRWIAAIRAGGQLPSRFEHVDNTALAADVLPMPDASGLSALELNYLATDVRDRLRSARSRDPLAGFPGTLGEALALDAEGGRMQEWLWQNDRNAMAAGVENRSPFLDHRLARWMGTGYAAKFDGPWNKRELRAQFGSFTPLATATRAPKQGFRWVYGRFMRNNRERIVEMIAGSTHARALIDRDRLLMDARRDDAVLELDATQRLMVVAGLEATGMLHRR